jgi:hypothetical protein
MIYSIVTGPVPSMTCTWIPGPNRMSKLKRDKARAAKKLRKKMR